MPLYPGFPGPTSLSSLAPAGVNTRLNVRVRGSPTAAGLGNQFFNQSWRASRSRFGVTFELRCSPSQLRRRTITSSKTLTRALRILSDVIPAVPYCVFCQQFGVGVGPGTPSPGNQYGYSTTGSRSFHRVKLPFTKKITRCCIRVRREANNWILGQR